MKLFTNFFHNNLNYTLSYLIKAMIVTNAIMFVYSILFNLLILKTNFSQIDKYLLMSFLAFIVSSASLYLYYLSANEKMVIYILSFYAIIFIILADRRVFPDYIKYISLTIVLLFMILTCFPSINIHKINGCFVKILLIFLMACLAISFAIRIHFCIRNDLSFLIYTLLFSKIFQHFTKKGIYLNSFKPIYVKLIIFVFFASVVVSSQSFFSWLPISPVVWTLQYLPYKYLAINFLFHIYLALINNSIPIKGD